MDLGDDGWPGFLVSRNTEPTLAFRNRGIPGRHSLRVDLQGPKGNRQAVGARVTAVYSDGTTQAGEVCAGSGYYSQSSAAVFFGSPDRNPLRRVQVLWPSGATTISPDYASGIPKAVRLEAPEN